MKTPLLLILLLTAAGGGFAGGILFQKSKSPDAPAPAQAEAKPQPPPKPKPPGRFHATTKFQVRKSGLPELTTAGTKRPEHDPVWFQSQVGILRTDDLMRRAVKVRKLEEEWNMPLWQAAQKVAGMIEVTVEPGTDIICVTGYSDKVLDAAEIPNAVREAYAEFRENVDEEDYQRVKQGCEYSVEMQRRKMEKLKTAMEEIARKNGLTSTVPPSPAAATSPANPPSDYTAARQEYEEALAMLTALREEAARQKLKGDIVRKHVEILENASPPDPRTQLAPPRPPQ